jgi:Tfp pilus assembly protein PilF
MELDPKYPPVYSLAGNVYYEVPRFLGGDLDKAEEMFRKGLDLNPRFTSARVGLARTLIKTGRVAEARRELAAVLGEKEPSNLADWTLKDSRRARELLESIKGKS